MFNAIAGNWRTSLLGAITGVATYFLAGPGVNLPTTRQDWFGLIAGLAQIVWGAVMKDATTGSKAA